jgi:hypothetical protein
MCCEKCMSGPVRTEVLKDLDRETRNDFETRNLRGSQQTTLPVASKIRQLTVPLIYIKSSGARA